ncbi:hypothetical protein Goari_012046, partial [Gossypium aridum]|nr:hypothetical protein [Gossypium aridum]
ECTITLEDVQLQLELPVDRPVETDSVVATDWKVLCSQLLRKVPDRIYSSRIHINWFKINFDELDAESSPLERE